ncbi:MAG: DUF1571 domain-containing protein [Deltaproteobacteria bacterium]|nr:DUF1571 domain-containing protein [Deltaproteobacteria bacterium]
MKFRWILYAYICLAIINLEGYSEEIDIETLLEEAQASYNGINDYTGIMHKQERIGKKLYPKETIFFKFAKPFKVYMKWIKDPYKGREMIYVEGWNDNKIKAHEGGLIGVVTVNLDPRGSMAMKGNRHPVTDMGIGNLLKVVQTNINRAKKLGDTIKVVKLGEEKIFGVDTIKLEAIFPKEKEKGYYCYRAILWIDKEKKLPRKIMVYDWEDQLVEDYSYENLQFNVGLTDKDFDPSNKEYNF